MRANFPTAGIFRARHAYTPTAPRFRYVTPAAGAQPCNIVADCWIVDRFGNIDPGYNVSPVPVARSAIGRRVA
jgi:hypothetical protein